MTVIPARSASRGLGRRAVALRDYGIVFSFLAIVVYLSVASPVFLTAQNLGNVLEQSATVGVIAAGGTLVIIAGGFDLSVGAIFALCGVVAAMVANALGVPAGIAAALIVGTLVGIANGLITTVGRINPFITTLGTAIIIRGITLSLTGGFLVAVEDPAFTIIGRDSLAGIKISIIIFATFTILVGVLLARTQLGRYMYASGGNPEAARLAGISVTRTRTLAFAISGLSAAIAGVMITSRSANGQAAAGQGLEFAAIAAIVVGGTSIFGGEGAIWRTVLGVLLLALIGNGFNLLAVPPTFQQIFQGAIILAAVGIDVWARRREGVA